MTRPVIVVCDPLRAEALAGIARTAAVAAVVSTGGRLSTKLTTVDSVATALEGPDGSDMRLVVLSPYRTLAADVALCRSRRVPVTLAGPLPAPRLLAPGSSIEAFLEGCDAGRWRYQPALQRLHATTAAEPFGAPVFLRHVGGGGSGMLGLWWSALEGLELTAATVGQPHRIWATATRGRGRWHASITVATATGATAQLVIAPTAIPGDEAMALGTGGLVWNEGVRDGVVEQSDSGARLVTDPAGGSDRWPDGAWLAGVLRADATPAALVDGHLRLNLLQALRQAARSGSPELLH